MLSAGGNSRVGHAPLSLGLISLRIVPGIACAGTVEKPGFVSKNFDYFDAHKLRNLLPGVGRQGDPCRLGLGICAHCVLSRYVCVVSALRQPFGP